jgi:hypothetical protein
MTTRLPALGMAAYGASSALSTNTRDAARVSKSVSPPPVFQESA